ncbi:SPTN4 protein, partial [Tricholaema leucomelas]|nr:SPTN4 protein [Tricholaema leucomelas]
GYQPCDPQVICNRVSHVRSCLEELQELAASRRSDLEASRQLWAFLQELEEAEAWMREKEQILTGKGCGRDLGSALALSGQHRRMLGELGGRRALLHQALQRGERLQASQRGSAGRLRQRLREVRQRWKKLEELTGLHQRRLRRALAFYQFAADAEDLAAWLQDLYRLASSDDFGHDDHSSRALLRQHRALLQQLEKQRGAVLGLRQQVASLTAPGGCSPGSRSARGGAAEEAAEEEVEAAAEEEEVVEVAVVDVQIRVVELEQLYGEVVEVALLRRQWLQDALAVYQMFGQVHACEVWLEEKEQWLRRMEVPQELDEVEVVQHRFESLDQEMNSLMGRILDVNQEVQQLLDGGHPSSEEVQACQDHLNSRWNRVVELVEQKKAQLSSVLRIQNYLLEC